MVKLEALDCAPMLQPVQSPSMSQENPPALTAVGLVQSANPPRRRGRPRKVIRLAEPDPRSFRSIVSAILVVPPSARPAAKAMASRMVDGDNGVSDIEGKVFRLMLEALNWNTGFLFVTNDRMARDLDVSLNAVERANKKLQARGYIKRERRPCTGRGGGHDFWRSTIPAVVPEANLLQHLPGEKFTAFTRQEIQMSASLTPQNRGVEPLVVVEERESAASLFDLCGRKAEAVPWPFHLPTEAQVEQFALTAAAWNQGEPIDFDRARSRLRQHLAKHLGGEAPGDVAEALVITLATVHEMALGNRSRGGSLGSYFGQALAGQLLSTKRRRVEHQAELDAIKGVADAKVASEVALGQRRIAHLDAAVANNAAHAAQRALAASPEDTDRFTGRGPVTVINSLWIMPDDAVSSLVRSSKTGSARYISRKEVRENAKQYLHAWSVLTQTAG